MAGDGAIGDGATNEAGGDSLQLPRQAPKKRRSELDNLKENLTDLMKAPVLPMSGSDDSEDVDKLREEEREKRKRKKDKGKSKEKHKAKIKNDKETPNAKLKDGKPSSGAVQLPTPSTTHSYASTNDGTPHQDDGADDEHHTEIRARGEVSMITPPPSNRTNSLDEDEDSDTNKRATRSGRSLRTGKGTPIKEKSTKSNPKTGSEPEDASESNAGGSDDDDSESSTSEEERRRTYALRHRKPVNKDQSGAPANARNGVRRVGTNGVGGPSAIHGHGDGKKGKVCITCKWNGLKTKNEITCGR